MDIISYALSKKGMQQSVSDYLDEHLTNPTNPPLDTSLTIANAAADSKATGDKLSELKEGLTQITETKTVSADKSSAVFTAYGTKGYISGKTGAFVAYNSYQVYYYEVQKDGYVWFTRNDLWNQFAVYNGTVFDTTKFVCCYRNNTDNFPTSSSKYKVMRGQTVAICCGSGRGDNFSYVYEDGLILNNFAVNTVISEISERTKKCVCVYRQTTVPDDTQIYYSDHASHVLSIYIPRALGYINFNIGRSQTTRTQAEGGYDVVRMCVLYAVDDSFLKRFEITRPGEWEMACKIYGADDFIGGFEHGDEWDQSVTYIIDGKVIPDITALTSLTEFNEIRVKTVSNMYDPHDHETLVGIHGKEWIITKDEAKLNQSIKWLFASDTEMTASYMTMFPAIRGNDEIANDQITDGFYTDINYAIVDCSEAGFDGQLASNTRIVSIFGNESGFYGSVEVLEYPSYPDSGFVYVNNVVNKANKIYYGVCGYGSTKGTVTPNQIWTSKSIYRLEVAEGNAS